MWLVVSTLHLTTKKLPPYFTHNFLHIFIRTCKLSLRWKLGSIVEVVQEGTWEVVQPRSYRQTSYLLTINIDFFPCFIWNTKLKNDKNWRKSMSREETASIRPTKVRREKWLNDCFQTGKSLRHPRAPLFNSLLQSPKECWETSIGPSQSVLNSFRLLVFFHLFRH